MQVILKQDIPNVGRIGEMVNVREGYARNFLIPRSLAIPAASGNLRQFEHQKRLVDSHKKKIQTESQGIAEKMRGLVLKLERRINDAGKLFGSLHSSDIVDLLKSKGHTIDKKDIEMPAIKEAGTFELKIRLPGDVFCDISLEIEGVEEKAAKPAKVKGAKTAKKAGAKKSTKAKAEDSEETSEEAE